MTVFRAARPPNKSPKEFGLDWGVVDERGGTAASDNVYAEAFARKLAAAMNYAYEQGRKDARK